MQDAVSVVYGRVLEEAVEVVRRSATFSPAARGSGPDDMMMTTMTGVVRVNIVCEGGVLIFLSAERKH